jgi:uncharacterized membrane protein (UPF0127 family)
MPRWSWSMLIWAMPLSGCASTDSHWVELNGRRFSVEIADTNETRTRGLMFRDALPDDQGMLFVFEREEPLAFWMRNTRIPLDIFYFDAARRLVSVAKGVPPCTTSTCPSYPSAAPARFTLELNAGAAKRLGTQRGDVLTLAPALASA